MSKSRDAFRTISEVADWLDTPAHVLRFWESKFTQVKPVKRAGGRRYYRPADMELLGGIKQLLHEDGMTIKGVQKVLREKGVKHVAALCARPVDEDGSAESAAPLAVEDVPEAGFIDVPEPDTIVPFPPQWAEPASDTGTPEARTAETVEAEAAETAAEHADGEEKAEPAQPETDETPLADAAFAALDPQADLSPGFDWSRPAAEHPVEAAPVEAQAEDGVTMTEVHAPDSPPPWPMSEDDSPAVPATDWPADPDDPASDATDEPVADDTIAAPVHAAQQTPAEPEDEAPKPAAWPAGESDAPAAWSEDWPVDPDDPVPPAADSPEVSWPAAQSDSPPVAATEWPDDPDALTEPPAVTPDAEPVFASEPEGTPAEQPDFGDEMPDFLRSVFDEPLTEAMVEAPTDQRETPPDLPSFLQAASEPLVRVPDDPDPDSLTAAPGPLSQLVQMTGLTAAQARMLPGIVTQLEQLCARRGL
ncbi:MerR family transcriptional regulator [Mesobacterium sp. TK19101]|uniref:MerR family transcriptional regulator n=1 Tax=Mesobacterium hydrothermale TaxID=3111907 RepID=A0ABU6HJX4_9RHOB|nr:MerR family transcriptional regulator [Mesobacterium sp. TK19101]MEC3862150.1 MerR family transcriptional regulator [Mesobacterium sp. TK19101]